ncbi:MAG: hypothetical protein KC493_15220 [Bacteriovoracaceae bacterium]|nr:hypothetical protein [Bacteriovoracaceae bacterium]
MTKIFDLSLETKIETWLADNIGLEFFKGGFDRLDKYFSDFKLVIQNSNTKIITIGGTNGKGQTSLFLEQILLENDCSVSVWTSPHILSVTERFRFNGRPLSQEDLFSLFEIAYSKIGSENLSYYEFLFYVFMGFVTENELPDYIILEVGLGGRLDAVNFFDPDLTALVSIGKDHQEVLGSTLKEILNEKLGITRSGTPLFSTVEQKTLREEINNLSKKKNFTVFDLFELNLIEGTLPFEKSNALLAGAMSNYLLGKSINGPSKLPLNLLKTELKGRREKMTLDKLRFIFIGAHNIDGMRKLTQSLAQKTSSEKNPSLPILWLSFSKRSEDEIHTMLDIWEASSCLYKEVWISPFDHPKAFESSKLIKLIERRQELKKGNIHLVHDWKNKIRNQTNREDFLVAGSYYFIGAIQRELYNIKCKRGISI